MLFFQPLINGGIKKEVVSKVNLTAKFAKKKQRTPSYNIDT